MFAAICAMRVPLFRMFGHLFMDAQPASDSAPEERILSTRNITHASKDVLASLVLSKHSGYVRLAGFHFCVIVLATLQHSRGESHVPKINCACHQRFSNHFACYNVFISPGWRIPMDLEHSIQFRNSSGEFKAPNNRVLPT